MKTKLITLISCLLLITTSSLHAQKTIKIDGDFDKIIVSPHIEAVLKKGNKASIQIEDLTVSEEKFKYELNNKTLQVYLEGAKTYTKNKKVVVNNRKRKVPLYKNRVAKIIITYTDVSVFSFRGEEKMTFKTPLIQEECKLSVYGKSEVTINDIKVEKLRVAIYGDSFLDMKKGNIGKQKITAYGASTIMASNVNSQETKITAYGDGNFQFNVSEKLKVTSYGEATILYKGEATLKNGIVIGESTIRRVD